MGMRVWNNGNESLEYWESEFRIMGMRGEYGIMGMRVWDNGNESMG